jgi:hypothetical protein
MKHRFAQMEDDGRSTEGAADLRGAKNLTQRHRGTEGKGHGDRG